MLSRSRLGVGPGLPGPIGPSEPDMAAVNLSAAMDERHPPVIAVEGRAINCPRRDEVDLELCLTCGWHRGVHSEGERTILRCGYRGGIDGYSRRDERIDWAMLVPF